MSSAEKYWISNNIKIPKGNQMILNEFLLSYKLANKAEATIRKYKSYLERFLSECTKPIEQLTSDDVFKWFNEFSIGKKEKTLDLVLSSLSSFFKFCIAEEYMEQMVTKKRWRPRIPESLPKYLTEQEYAHVKRIAEQLSLRDRALILFLFSSGCRRSEVAQLTIQDVAIDRRTVEVKGKGKKIRHVHFSEECALVLKDYLETRTIQPTDPLFVNKFGNALQGTGIYQVTKKLGIESGLKQTLHPHSCRHTFATNLLAKGAKLDFIADEMGHADLNTTRVYARIPSEDLITAYKNIME